MSNQRYSVVKYTLLVLLVCPVRAGDQGQTVYITQAKGSHDKQLLDALSNPRVTTIVFTTDYDVDSQVYASAGDRAQLQRSHMLLFVHYQPWSSQDV